jgi:hypothetical protein
MPLRRPLALSVLLLGAAVAGAAAPPDEYESENKATTVRPAARGEVLDASDVKAVAAAEGKKVTVRGKVHEVHLSRTKKVLKLNFGPDFRTCFTGVIFAGSFSAWDGGTDGIRRAYQGRTVTLNGEVKMYGGLPEMIIRGPQDVQISD